MSIDEEFMLEALTEAQKSYEIGEVPVGAVVVKDGEIVGRGHNLRETDKNALRHAELIAIDEACMRLGGWRLWHCDLYVTLEPCPMCAGSLIHARIRRVIFGAGDSRNGALGSVCNLMDYAAFNHHYTVTSGILAEPCSRLLKDFFKARR